MRRLLAADSSDQTNQTVACPEGTVAIGGGHRGAPELVENSGFPTIGGGEWAFFLDNMTSGQMSATPAAVCSGPLR